MIDIYVDIYIFCCHGDVTDVIIIGLFLLLRVAFDSVWVYMSGGRQDGLMRSRSRRKRGGQVRTVDEERRR